MTKIVKSKYKASRRLGTAIWDSSKDAVIKRNYRPGQHGKNTIKTSDYGNHLKAKQRIKCHYGRITERQFRNLFIRARKMKGNTAENFIALLESRVDTILYRSKVVPTIFAARQVVSHGHIRVNGKKVNIPSQKLFIGDVIELKNSSKEIPMILESIKKPERAAPDYLTVDSNSLSVKINRFPSISDVPYPFEPEVNLIVELYSR